MNKTREWNTEQEKFWAGEFGTEYVGRNQGDLLLASNISFFTKALRSAHTLNRCIEFGANIGMNLKALKLLYPEQEQYGIEINPDAAKELSNVIPSGNIHECSILDFVPQEMSWDLVLIKGVLIHINPDALPQVYDKLVSASGRYLLIAEYYNPVPVSITYRGHEDRLFKRDFVGEIMELHSELRLIDYGFCYHKDPNFPQDDITWFLLEK